MAKTALTDAQKAEKKAEAAAAKASNFVRLAEKRTEKALIAIAAIGGLSNTNTYTYTEAQTNVILKALQDEVLRLQARFSPQGAVASKGFSLSAAQEPAPAE
jgi:hypothetical protein